MTLGSVAVAPDESDALLQVSGLEIEISARQQTIRAVRGLSYRIRRGESFGLVGESGSGKSISARAVLGLLPRGASRVTGGSIRFDGIEMVGLPEHEFRRIRGARIAFVPQDPHVSLNPVLTIGRQISEVLQVHRGMGRRAASQRAIELLSIVGIADAPRRIDEYPHQFSGGMRQRVIIAIALACEPELLIADEPTTALDVTIQAQILDLLHKLKEDYRMAVLLITHDLGIVAGFTDRVGVMYAGRIVETGPTDLILRRPAHPYSVGLLRAIPRLDLPRLDSLVPILGAPPDLAADLPGCPFAERCGWRVPACWTDEPPIRDLRNGWVGPATSGSHATACHNPPTPDEVKAGHVLRDGFIRAGRP